MELRPCPFCKSKKVKIQTNWSEYNYTAKATGRCNACHARGPLFTMRINKPKDKEIILKELIEKATKAWNGEE